MTHYAHILTLNCLELDAYVGFYEKERNEKQKIQISFRLYFPEEIESMRDDNAGFFHYGKLAESIQSFVLSQKFNLIEYMTMAMFRHMRGEIDKMGGPDVKLWLELNKINAPVPGLLKGASFMHSDLPAGATFIPSVLQ